MRKILAAIDTSAAAGPVLATARAIAKLYDGSVEAVHVREGSAETPRAAAETAVVPLRTYAGSPLETLLSVARDDEVVAVVLGARGVPLAKRPVGHVTLELIASLRKPVVVVPPTASRGEIKRVLVPLEGTRSSSTAVADIIERACSHGFEVVLLHVHDERSVPRFSEQPQYEADAWADEFLARYCSCLPENVRLEVRAGSPGEHVVRTVEETGSHLLALCWSQVLAADRARVVRQCLERSSIPILLLPELPAPKAE